MAVKTSTLIARLLDRVSGPAKAMAASLKGVSRATDALAVSARNANVASMQIARQARLNSVALNDVRGKMFDAAAAGFALKKAFQGTTGVASDFETTLLDIAQKADMSDAAMKALGGRIKKLAPEINKSAGEVAKSMDILMGMGLDEKRAEAAIKPIGRVATAYRAELEDVSKAAFAAMDNLKVAPQDLERALDAMAQAGKEGAFELKDMAAQFPSLTAAAQALKMNGVDGVAKLSAALQIARKGAGDSASAATNTANLLQKIISPETTKKFQKQGINIRKELKWTQDQGGDVFEMIARVVQKATKGDLSKLGDFFEDSQVQQFLRPLIQNLDEYRKIRDKAKSAKGVVDKDFARRMQTAAEQTKALSDSLNAVGLSVGTSLLPSLNELMLNLKGLALRFEGFAEANPALVSGLVKVTASLVALKIATTATAYAYRVLRGAALSTMAVLAATRARLMMASAGMTALMTGTKLTTKAIAGLRLILLSSGIGAAVVALGAAAAFLAKNWNGVKKAVVAFSEAFKKALSPDVAASLKPLMDAVESIAGFFNEITGEIDPKKWEEFGRTAGTATAEFMNNMKEVAKAVKATADGFKAIGDWFSGPGNLMNNTLRELRPVLELYKKLFGDGATIQQQGLHGLGRGIGAMGGRIINASYGGGEFERAAYGGGGSGAAGGFGGGGGGSESGSGLTGGAAPAGPRNAFGGVDPMGGGGPSGAPGSVVGAPGVRTPAQQQNAAAIMRELKAAGYSDNAIAAVMGSMQTESSFNPRARNNIAGGHTGLWQWDKNRWPRIANWIKSKGGDPADAAWQTKAWVAEHDAKPGDPMYDHRRTEAGGRMLRDNPSIQQAIQGVRESERFGRGEEGGRAANAARWLPHVLAGAAANSNAPGNTAQRAGDLTGQGGAGAVDQRQGGAQYRRQAITDELQAQLAFAGRAAGVNAEVFSGGQDPRHQHGSTRHNHGRSADVRLYVTDENGRKRYLNPNNPADRERYAAFIRGSARAGATGIGHGPGYMSGTGIHVGGGSPAVWGAGGASRNAPDWVREAYRSGTEERKRLGLPDLKGGGQTAGSPVPRIMKPAGDAGTGAVRDGLSLLNRSGASPAIDSASVDSYLDKVRTAIRETGQLGAIGKNVGGGRRTGKVMTAMRGAFSSQGMG